jgi:acyl-coenzyme A thioesterase PaaI-like protein
VTAEASAPPDGFVESRDRGPYTTHNGPLFHKRDGERFFHGFRVLKRHCNGLGTLHGGMLMSFADGLMGGACFVVAKVPAMTVRVTADFLSIAKTGDWIEGEARVKRATKSLVFVEADIHANGRLIMTASGIFKIMEAHAMRARRRLEAS